MTAKKLELLARVATLLDNLGPFTDKTRREDKWRTTEQIANELELFGKKNIDDLDRVLREHEARCLRSKKRLPPDAVIRRAKYPDRTTALPLWGSLKHHKWITNRPDQSDPQIGSWRFETHIEQRGDIAECVRKAIEETSCLVALVTRHSIASLWVLTELHTALRLGIPLVLVVNANDALLLKLLESVRLGLSPRSGRPEARDVRIVEWLSPLC